MFICFYIIQGNEVCREKNPENAERGSDCDHHSESPESLLVSLKDRSSLLHRVVVDHFRSGWQVWEVLVVHQRRELPGHCWTGSAAERDDCQTLPPCRWETSAGTSNDLFLLHSCLLICSGDIYVHADLHGATSCVIKNSSGKSFILSHPCL